MFIHTFNEKQQNAFLYLAKKVIEADSVYSEQEENIMREISTQLPKESYAQYIELSELPELFDSSLIKRQLIIELLGISFSDSSYHHSEILLINKISKILDVNDYEIKFMSQWISKMSDLHLEMTNYFKKEVA